MVGCLTIKQYPAWALSLVKRCDPTRALMVQEDAHIIAVNRHAVRAGIETGMTAARARSLCPEALLLIRDAVSEYCAWEYVVEHLHRTTPFLESSQPVAWFSARPREVRDTARHLRACVGFAPDRSTAHLAAVRSNPGGTTVVRPEEMEAFLDAFPSPLLLDAGFSEDLVDGLELLGCSTLGPARKLNSRQLKLAFGKEGVALYPLLHPGVSGRIGVYHPPPSIRSHFELEAPCSQPGDLMPIVCQLNERAALAMNDQFAGQVRIILRPEGRDPVHGSRVLPHPTSRADTLERYGLRLAGEMLQSLHVEARKAQSRPIDIDRIDYVLASLMTGDLVQASLFGERLRKVTSAVGEVHRRYPNSIKRGLVRAGAHFHEDRISLRTWEASDTSGSARSTGRG
ncbi:MAG: hypothetical protein JJ896_04620 [Rhodothermales bacterium]|nr:hypothetical protein [Rhodothermales bacterium]MBO6778916.1 hypothetical protein [Rhodothermales bacterium]